jgi:DNA-binding protein YbaB
VGTAHHLKPCTFNLQPAFNGEKMSKQPSETIEKKRKLKRALEEVGIKFQSQGHVRINFTGAGDVGKIEILRTE